MERVCYEGDSKEERDWNVDETGAHRDEKPKNKKKTTTAKPAPLTTKKARADTSPCEKDFDSGPCFSSKPMYYYRKETKKCEMFVYGGCGGNDNRFETQKACQEKCARG